MIDAYDGRLGIWLKFCGANLGLNVSNVRVVRRLELTLDVVR